MSLYEACDELFAAYPLAVTAVDHGGTVRSMVLLLRDGDDAGFFVLSRDGHESRPAYSLFPWRGGVIVDIGEDGRSRRCHRYRYPRNSDTTGRIIVRVDRRWFGHGSGSDICQLHS